MFRVARVADVNFHAELQGARRRRGSTELVAVCGTDIRRRKRFARMHRKYNIGEMDPHHEEVCELNWVRKTRAEQFLVCFNSPERMFNYLIFRMPVKQSIVFVPQERLVRAARKSNRCGRFLRQLYG